MSVNTGGPGETPLVNLTEEGLMRLLRDVQQGGGPLPPGAYRDEGGRVWRNIHEPTGRTRLNKATGKREAVNRVIRRPVYMTYDMSPEGLVAGRKAAARRGLDFYWPGPGLEGAPGLPSPTTSTIGWLRAGTKRENDVESNLGAGAQHYEMQYVPLESEDDEDGTSAVMQGVPIESELVEIVNEANTRTDDEPDPFSAESVKAAAAASRRSGRGE